MESEFGWHHSARRWPSALCQSRRLGWHISVGHLHKQRSSEAYMENVAGSVVCHYRRRNMRKQWVYGPSDSG